MNELLPSWQRAWSLAGLAEPSREVFEALCRAYAEPQRHYHTLQHLRECLAQADEIERLAERPGEVLIALWFHDAVYDTHARGNEQRSADWAREVVTRAGSAEIAERVHRLVMATEHHAVPDTRDAQVLVDVDLSILAAEGERFREYARQVREEYRHVPEFIYRRKRHQVLKGFLARPRLFSTEAYRERLEGRARENLHESVAELEWGGLVGRRVDASTRPPEVSLRTFVWPLVFMLPFVVTHWLTPVKMPWGFIAMLYAYVVLMLFVTAMQMLARRRPDLFDIHLEVHDDDFAVGRTWGRKAVVRFAEVRRIVALSSIDSEGDPQTGLVFHTGDRKVSVSPRVLYGSGLLDRIRALPGFDAAAYDRHDAEANSLWRSIVPKRTELLKTP